MAGRRRASAPPRGSYPSSSRNQTSRSGMRSSNRYGEAASLTPGTYFSATPSRITRSPHASFRSVRLGVLPDRQARRVGDYHQTVRSIDSSTSSASQKSADRYFQPASARTQRRRPRRALPRGGARRGRLHRPRHLRRRPHARSAFAGRRRTRRSRRAPSDRACRRRGSAARSRRPASAGPSPDHPAAAPAATTRSGKLSRSRSRRP